MKPAAATSPGAAPEPGNKSGTTIVKTAPPKETARITVRPSLPATPAVRAGGNLPKPAVAAVPVAAAAAGAVVGAAVAKATATPAAAKPATTIVKTAAKPVAATATVKAGPAPGSVKAASAPAAAPAKPVVYQEEASTTLTTVLAGVLAVLTWGTAGVLIASLMSWI